ncbi:MAG: hypothetical protein AAFO07_27700 [Bacteroidota bacterium]
MAAYTALAIAAAARPWAASSAPKGASSGLLIMTTSVSGIESH